VAHLFHGSQGGSSTRRGRTQAALGMTRVDTEGYYAVDSCNVRHVNTQFLQNDIWFIRCFLDTYYI
jgi:hypothetical protein